MRVPLPFDDCHAHVGYWDGMDVERIIDEIEQIQEMFEAPDIRPLSGNTEPSAIGFSTLTVNGSPRFLPKEKVASTSLLRTSSQPLTKSPRPQGLQKTPRVAAVGAIRICHAIRKLSSR
jgi:hypothetical protein